MLRKAGIVLFSCVLIFGIWLSKAQAASLYLSPGSKQVNVGSTINVKVLVDSQSQAINNASAIITFPTDLLQVESVTKSGSVFSIWVEDPSFSNQDGSITFNGGVPTPGYNGSSGSIINIVFRAKAEGTATVLINSGSVLANDGLGTDVLSSKGQAQFTLIKTNTPTPTPTPAATPQTQPTSAGTQIFSLTHPNQNAWYSNPNPSFNWTLDKGVSAIKILYDKNPNSQPSVVYSPPISEKSLSGIDDGSYYFHLQEKNSSGWGGISHFHFQIDTQKPDYFNIKEIARVDLTDPTAKFIFDSADKTSGIDHYLVQIDGGQAQTWTASSDNVYETPVLQSGQHTLIAKAVDKAGNYLVNTADFEIKALEPPVITKYPETINENALLALKGTATANSKISIWLKKDKTEAVSHESQSDSDGNFSLIIDDNLIQGVYTMWAKVEDGRGAESGSSNIVTVVVTKSLLAKTGLATLGFLEIAVPIIALLVLLTLILWYSWHKFIVLKKKLKRDAGESELAVHKVFNDLRDNMQRQVRLLEKTKVKRDLTTEELKIFNQLRKDLSGMEEFLTDEIEQIQTDLK